MAFFMHDFSVRSSVSDVFDRGGKPSHQPYPSALVSMKYPIPTNSQEMIALRQQPVNEELVASAIAGVINIARSRQQSLEDLKAEVLADDNLLDLAQRRCLWDIVAQAWDTLPT